MPARRIMTTITALTLSLPAFAHAAITGVDWLAPGDSLITHDSTSGLNWLDLTETNEMSRDYVLTQLVPGGLFEGWRYATSAEVVSLWSAFGVDLSATADTVAPGYADSGVEAAARMLGNIYAEYDITVYPYGTAGVTADALGDSTEWYKRLGAYQKGIWTVDTYYKIDGDLLGNYYFTEGVSTEVGHYLVQSSAVPLPAAIWLLGSGLVGLGAVGRRK